MEQSWNSKEVVAGDEDLATVPAIRTAARASEAQDDLEAIKEDNINRFTSTTTVEPRERRR